MKTVLVFAFCLVLCSAYSFENFKAGHNIYAIVENGLSRNLTCMRPVRGSLYVPNQCYANKFEGKLVSVTATNITVHLQCDKTCRNCRRRDTYQLGCDILNDLDVKFGVGAMPSLKPTGFFFRVYQIGDCPRPNISETYYYIQQTCYNYGTPPISTRIGYHPEEEMLIYEDFRAPDCPGTPHQVHKLEPYRCSMMPNNPAFQIYWNPPNTAQLAERFIRQTE